MSKNKSKSKIKSKGKGMNPEAHSKRGRDLSGLSLGGGPTDYPDHYTPQALEAFENKNPQTWAWTTFVCPEFTSLCPKTHQPDFAKITIHYVADKKMIESKSLKIYLFSFRNHGDFHEDCVQTICDDIYNKIQPFYVEVLGDFTPRGGISIHPFASRVRPRSQRFFQDLYQHRFLSYPTSYPRLPK